MISETIQQAAFVLTGAALAIGALVAQISAPLSCSWTMRLDELKTRLLALGEEAPNARRSFFGALLIGALLMGGSVAAYAAAPVEPERLTTVTGLESLPREVAGVVGSGNQLRLQLRIDGQPRTLSVGDEYRDGWVLKGLTDTLATLNKGAQVRMVGLNPTGSTATDAASASKSLVTVLGLLTTEQQATLQAEIDSGRWDGRPAWGMTQDESNRLLVYDDQNSDALTAWYAKNWVAGVAALDISTRPTAAEIFGSDLEDRQKLQAARNAYREAHYAEEMAMPLTGPSSLYIPAGTKVNDAMVAAGASPAGVWTYSVADDKGGRTLTRIDSPVYDSSLNQAGAAMAMANRGTPQK
ncbi:MAG: hypothetical protein JWM33_3310 [Caulobacteraceae bacterium]|nr:hypothetical protein [Caulobacteraceae bacterium]